MTGKPYRLLTEAEYEYAARAGSTTAYSFGNDPALLAQYGWYNANSGAKPHPVGEKRPNAWGLYDLQGDVWQWLEDCYHDNYEGAPTDGSPWTAGKCSYRVLRGGSWYSAPELLRSGHREWRSKDNRSDNRGFRVRKNARALKSHTDARGGHLSQGRGPCDRREPTDRPVIKASRGDPDILTSQYSNHLMTRVFPTPRDCHGQVKDQKNRGVVDGSRCRIVCCDDCSASGTGRGRPPPECGQVCAY